MTKRRYIAFILCLLLVFSLSTAAFASDYCAYKVDGGICGKTLTWGRTGESGLMNGSHTYNNGKNICNYGYFYIYFSYVCAAGHVSQSRQDRHEYDHWCGIEDSR